MDKNFKKGWRGELIPELQAVTQMSYPAVCVQSSRGRSFRDKGREGKGREGRLLTGIMIGLKHGTLYSTGCTGTLSVCKEWGWRLGWISSWGNEIEAYESRMSLVETVGDVMMKASRIWLSLEMTTQCFYCLRSDSRSGLADWQLQPNEVQRPRMGRSVDETPVMRGFDLEFSRNWTHLLLFRKNREVIPEVKGQRSSIQPGGHHYSWQHTTGSQNACVYARARVHSWMLIHFS